MLNSVVRAIELRLTAAQRVPLEERARVVVELAEPLPCTDPRTRRRRRAGSARGRRARRKSSSPRAQRERDRLVREQAVEDHEVVARRVVHGAEHERASPKNTSTSRVEQLLQPGRDSPGPARSARRPAAWRPLASSQVAAGRAGDDGERRVLQDLRGRRAAPHRSWTSRFSASALRSAGAASARRTARLPPGKTGIENATPVVCASVTLIGVHSRSMLPCCTSRRRAVERHRHPVHGQLSAARAASSRVGDPLAQRDAVAFGGARIVAERRTAARRRDSRA